MKCTLASMKLVPWKFPGADLGFSERGAKHSGGSLKQGVCPPEAIGYFVL